VTTLTQVAQLALMLENTAAQTYQAEASKLKSAKAVAVAATIQPVEMQHAAILYYVLGEYPGIQDSSGNPLAFNPTTLAA
jgi:rubrerythrin